MFIEDKQREHGKKLCRRGSKYLNLRDVIYRPRTLDYKWDQLYAAHDRVLKMNGPNLRLAQILPFKQAKYGKMNKTFQANRFKQAKRQPWHRGGQ